MAITILISIFTWISWKKKSPPRPAIWQGIPICNSKVPDTAGRKTRKRRTRAIAIRYAFHKKAKTVD